MKDSISVCVDCWDDICQGYEQGNKSAELFLHTFYPRVTYVSPEECEVCSGKRKTWVDRLRKNAPRAPLPFG